MAENIDLKYLKVNRSDFSDPVKAAEWAQKKLGMGFEVKIRKLKKIKHLPFLTIIKWGKILHLKKMSKLPNLIFWN